MRRLLIGLVTVTSVVAMVPVVGRAEAPPPVDECDWAMFGNGPHHRGAVVDGCSSIEPDTVSALAPRFLYRARDSVTATPAIVDGVLYVGAWDGTFAAYPAAAQGIGDPTLEAAGATTVQPLWTFEIDDGNDVSFGRIVSTAAVADVPTPDSGGTRRIVMFGGGATVYALDAATGTEVARACLDPRSESHAVADQLAAGLPPNGRCGGSVPEIEVESSPVVTPHPDGSVRVTIGMDVHNASDVGRAGIVHLRLARVVGPEQAHWSFEPVWKLDPEGIGEQDGLDGTYTPATTGDPLTYKSHTGEGCAGVWGTPAVDLIHDVVIFGTASCKQAGMLESGDVVGESVFAARHSTGELLWRYDPPRPWGTRTDDDFGASAQLFEVDGRLLAGIAGKDGGYYTFDVAAENARAAAGEIHLAAPVWTAQPGQPGHLNQDFAIGGIIGTPAVGAVEVLDAAGATAVERTAIFATTAISTPVGRPLGTGTPPEWIDQSLADDPGRMLSLHAFDAATGELLWRSPVTRQAYGHPTYVNGVVLVPSTAGFQIDAFDASTGVLLWAAPVNGAPSSGAAVVGDSVYIGVGTRQTDAGYKAFESDSVLGDVLGSDPQERLAGIWAFQLAVDRP